MERVHFNIKRTELRCGLMWMRLCTVGGHPLVSKECIHQTWMQSLLIVDTCPLDGWRHVMDVDKGHKGVSATRHEGTTSLIMLITDIAQDFEPDGYLTDVTSVSTANTPDSYVLFRAQRHAFYICKGLFKSTRNVFISRSESKLP